MQIQMNKKEKFASMFIALMIIVSAMYASEIYHPLTKAAKVAACAKVATAQPATYKSFDELTNNLPGQYKVHEKKNGKVDTMWSIAKRYDIGIKQLYTMNNMPYGATIYPGQLITVPR